MAITYFGSKKLMGTKVDRVSDSLGSSGNGNNSGITLLGATETLKNTPDYTFNFSSDTDWDRVGSGTSNTVYIDTSAGHIRHNTTTNTSAMKKVYYDLTDYTSGSAVNDSKWTMRFKWVVTNQSAPSSWLMALSANTTDPDSASWNGIGVHLNDGTGSYGYHITTCDGSTKTMSSNVTTPSNSQTLYFELKRTSATNATLTCWSDSYNGTQVGTTQSLTIPSGVTSLKYLQSGSGQGGNSSRTMNATLDDLEIFDDSITFSGAKLGSGSYSFDGSNDYVSFGSASDWKFLHDGTSNTVAFWVKRDGTQASSEPCVIDTQGASASKKGISFYWTNNSAGTLTYSVSDGSGSDTKSVVCGNFTDGQWHHVAVTYDGSNITSYKDGTQNAQTSLSGHTPSTADPSYTLHAGRNTRGSTYYKGDVDDIGIYKRALTTTEIGKLANSNIDGSDGWVSVAGSSSTKNITVDASNQELDFKFYGGNANGNGSVAYVDIGAGEISNTDWALQFTINYSTQVGNQGVGWVGLSDSIANSTTTQDGVNAVFMNNDNQVFGKALNGQTPNDNWGSGTSATLSEDTNYYVTLKRTDANNGTIDIKTGSHSGSSLTNYPASISSLSSSVTGLRYIKVMDREGYSNTTNGDVGTIKDIKFWKNTDDTSTTPTSTYSFTAGSAQSVSTISNKAGLKAHYPMDATTSTVVDDNLSTDSGWVSTVTGNGYDATNYRVNFKLSCPPDSSSHAGGRVIIDVQDADWLDGSNMPDNFTARFKWRVSAMANASQNENRSYMGFFSSDAWGGTSQDSFYIQFWTNTTGIQTFRCECINGGTFQGGSENRVITSLTPSLNTDYYIELKKAGNTHTYRITTNSDYTGGTTATVTQSGIEGLRYFGFKSRGDNQANGGNNEGYIDDITITEDSLCPNDASATSDLEVQTNLLANSTFLQIDGTPQYYWKQSDNTWEIDGLYNAPAYSYILGGRVSGANINNITKGLNATNTMTMASSGTITTAQSGLCGCENDDNTNVYLIYHSTNSGYAKNIDKIPTATDTPSVVDVGDMPTVGSDGQGASSTTHGYSYGGNGGGWYRNSIEKFSFSTNGDGTDVGDMTYSGQHLAGAEDKTNGYGYHHGGYNGSGQTGIGRWSFTTDGNASSVGSLATSGTVGFAGAGHNETHVWQFGGRINNGSWTDDIQKYAFGSSVSCSKIGDMSTTTFGRGGVTDDNDTAWISGGSTNGENTPTSNVVKYAFNVDSAETDIGDLPSATFDCAGCDGK